MKGQGALEYLIMIVAVIAIATVVIVMLTGTTRTQQVAGNFVACKDAAIQCRNMKNLDPSDPCRICEKACVDSSGKDIMAPWGGSAITCCKRGDMSKIYEGSSACVVPYITSGVYVVKDECKEVSSPEGGTVKTCYANFSWSTSVPTNYTLYLKNRAITCGSDSTSYTTSRYVRCSVDPDSGISYELIFCTSAGECNSTTGTYDCTCP
ncbi:MAG: class III signal peptide-containing protein [archaeon]